MQVCYKKRVEFIGKSLLWSLLLYTVAILLLDGREAMRTLSGKSSMQLVQVKAEYKAKPADV